MRKTNGETGSALIMTLFVFALLTGMGITLLLVTETEVKMSKVDQRSKQAFYISEAGLEDARETLRAENAASTSWNSFSDELDAHAGVDDTVDFDLDAVTVSYDSDGNVTGFGGFDDDQPLLVNMSFAGGAYAVFLTNDPVDNETNLTDSNRRVMLTSIAAGPDRSVEATQAVVLRRDLASPATITILGDDPVYDGGTSDAKQFMGDDCADPTLDMPVVGAIGADAETDVESGVHKPATYSSGTETGLDTVSDVESTIDQDWLDCEFLLDLTKDIRTIADVVGDSSTPDSALGTPGAPKIVYIEGDYTVSGGLTGGGLLWVTGTLDFNGGSDWYGSLFAVGDGSFVRSGGGSGYIQGNIFVASISGPDGEMWTADDCSGPDGIPGNGDDGIGSGGSFDNSGGGDGDTGFCLPAIQQVSQLIPLRIVDFAQR
jgi:hypothetical protein